MQTRYQIITNDRELNKHNQKVFIMGRCPDYLNVDDFDKLAESVDIQLTDDGVSALGEIIEFLALRLINRAQRLSSEKTLDYEHIISAAKSAGFRLTINADEKKVISADYGD
jgi:hypothetical protein